MRRILQYLLFHSEFQKIKLVIRILKNLLLQSEFFARTSVVIFFLLLASIALVIVSFIFRDPIGNPVPGFTGPSFTTLKDNWDNLGMIYKVLGRLRVLRVKTCKLRVTCKTRNPHDLHRSGHRQFHFPRPNW